MNKIRCESCELISKRPVFYGISDTVSFFKKGTAHLVFKDMELLEKFNLFAGQKKGWLPPCYGKKRYADMTEEEQRVIDSFQGRERYAHIMAHADYYIENERRIPLMLNAG